MAVKCDDAKVMRMWRESGLPEYFLGNGGTNYKLVAFADAVRREALEEAAARCISSGAVTSMDACIAVRALIEAAPNEAPPAPLDVVRALARLFQKNWQTLPLHMLMDAGLFDDEGKPSALGKAALALAEGKDGCLQL